jgi:hypothetical protein
MSLWTATIWRRLHRHQQPNSLQCSTEFKSNSAQTTMSRIVVFGIRLERDAFVTQLSESLLAAVKIGDIAFVRHRARATFWFFSKHERNYRVGHATANTPLPVPNFGLQEMVWKSPHPYRCPSKSEYLVVQAAQCNQLDVPHVRELVMRLGFANAFTRYISDPIIYLLLVAI